MTGYLIADHEFTVPFDSGRRTFQRGVNKDVTPEMADHWYVKANKARYVEKLEDVHKELPETVELVKRARSSWEQNQRLAIQAQLSAQRERKDLERLEKEYGIDTKARDKEFEAALEQERKQAEALMTEAEERQEAQLADDAKSSSSAAEAERKAAGSEEVANTEMDGPAKEEAEKAAANPPLPTESADALNRNPDPGTQAKPEDTKKPSTEEQERAAGSKETANTGTQKDPEPDPKDRAAADPKKATDDKTKK